MKAVYVISVIIHIVLVMEIPKVNNKDTIEDELNSLYIKSENAKEEIRKERIAYGKILINSCSVIVPIKSYDMIIIKSVLQ